MFNIIKCECEALGAGHPVKAHRVLVITLPLGQMHHPAPPPSKGLVFSPLGQIIALSLVGSAVHPRLATYKEWTEE